MLAPVATPSDALSAIRAAGVRLHLDDAGRIIAAPRSAISDDVRDLIRSNRDGLAALLRPASCPSDVAERVALKTAGYESWGGLASRLTTDIASELDGLPEPSSRDGQMILSATRGFIRSPEFGAAIAAGWSEGALFGIRDPRELPHVGGLVVRWALGFPGARLVAIDANRATFERPGGGMIWRGRFSVPEIENAAPWWQCPALIGEAE